MIVAIESRVKGKCLNYDSFDAGIYRILRLCMEVVSLVFLAGRISLITERI